MIDTGSAGRRPPALSVRLKLTLSYAGLLLLAGTLLLVVVWLYLLRYVPERSVATSAGFVPGRGDLVRAFVPPAAAALVGLLVVGVGGGWFLAGRMLAPLARITAATRLTAAGSLSHRIDSRGSHDEFRDLSDSFDAMLGRIEAHVDEQRRFAANASHELRTPLAITQAMLDVGAADPHRDVAALLRRLRQMNDRAIALTEALLMLSRAERGGFETAAIDLSLAVDEAVETLLPLAEAHDVEIVAKAASARVRGSEPLVHQLVANLLHNAIVHNRASGGTVEIDVHESADGVRLRVENSGSVIDPATLPTLIEPFQRGAGRARHGQSDGAGLGLAIVARIVRAHGGRLELRARPEGGLAVQVVLPVGRGA